MVPNITPPKLRPKIRSAIVDGKMEDILNADAVIAICRTGETPEARMVYAAFRRHYADLCISDPSAEDQANRWKAIVSALESIGVQVVRADQ